MGIPVVPYGATPASKTSAGIACRYSGRISLHGLKIFMMRNGILPPAEAAAEPPAEGGAAWN
jgi:hypothetical protein